MNYTWADVEEEAIVDAYRVLRYEALHAAIAAIASQCDGAKDRDGVGFNSLDTKFGRRIAAMDPGDWTDEIARDASAILPIYRKQLDRLGINVDSLPLVKDAERNYVARDQARAAERKVKNAPYAVLDNGTVKVFNSFGIKDQLKAANAGYRFNGNDKSWDAKLSKSSASIVVELGVELRDGGDQIKEAANAPEADAPAKPRFLGKVMYDKANDLIHIASDYNAELVEAIRALPGRKWDSACKINTCFVDAKVLELAERFSLEVTQPARDAIEAKAARVAASYATETATETALADTLRPYQQAGTAYAVEQRRSFNADEMGLGKTLQSIAAAETIGKFPVLVTCPASLRGNWIREIARWSPHRTAAIWDGKGDAPDTDYVVCSYEAATKAAS